MTRFIFAVYFLMITNSYASKEIFDPAPLLTQQAAFHAKENYIYRENLLPSLRIQLQKNGEMPVEVFFLWEDSYNTKFWIRDLVGGLKNDLAMLGLKVCDGRETKGKPVSSLSSVEPLAEKALKIVCFRPNVSLVSKAWEHIRSRIQFSTSPSSVHGTFIPLTGEAVLPLSCMQADKGMDMTREEFPGAIAPTLALKNAAYLTVLMEIANFAYGRKVAPEELMKTCDELFQCAPGFKQQMGI